MDAFNEETEDPECTWYRAVYYVRPTTCGRWAVEATLPSASDGGLLKLTHSHVVSAAVDWSRCLLRTPHGLQVTAGTPYSVYVAMFDSYDNEVEADPRALTVDVVNRSTDGLRSAADIPHDLTVSRSNELVLQIAPEVAGLLHCCQPRFDPTGVGHHGRREGARCLSSPCRIRLGR